METSLKKLNQAERDQYNRLLAWVDLLNRLPGVRFARIEDENECDASHLIWGMLRSDYYLPAVHYGRESYDDYFIFFNKGNKAEIRFDEPDNSPEKSQSIKGTWEEVYHALLEYIEEEIKVPDLPS